jgi:glycosyltransferase involved in cell wall biosynthesis
MKTPYTGPPKVISFITRLIVGGAQETAIYTAAGLGPEYSSLLVTGPQTGAEGELHTEAARLGVPPLVLTPVVRQISLIKDVRALVALWRLFRRERPDIVHTHSSKAGILGRLAARLARVPVIVHTVHGWPFHTETGRLDRGIYMWLERRMARFTDRLIAVSAKDIESGVAARIGDRARYTMVPNGVELSELLAVERTLPSLENVRVIGGIMRLVPQKDPQTFVRAAALVASRLPDTRFEIAGGGPLKDELERLAGELGLNGNFEFLGIRRDLTDLLASFDIFVATSLWEGLPRAVVEAMASGLPVIAADVGGVSEVIKDGYTGWLVPPGDPAAIASCMEEILKDPEHAAAIGKRGREAVRNLGTAEMLEQTKAIYSELLSAKGVTFGVPDA